MVRNKTVIIVGIVLLFMPTVIFAVDTPCPIDAVMADLRADQGLKPGDSIDVNKVSQNRLEELGDSVMEANLANSALHERMDAMMGGDGSASLSLVHQRIAYNYLMGYPWGMMGMMGALPAQPAGGGYMMGGYGYPGYGMMAGWGWLGMVFGLLVLALIIVVAVLAIRHFLSNGRGSHSMNGNGAESPLDILKKRYARGEITKDEFERIKKDID